MRIALIGPGTLAIPPSGWGAVERVIWNLHQQSGGAGFETIVVNSREAAEIGARCTAFRPDVLHLHAYGVLPATLPYLTSRPTPLVATIHDARLGRRVRPEVAPLVDVADAVIALSPAIEKVLRGCRDDGVFYVPNGVDTRLFRPLPKVPRSVAAVGNNTARKRFADVARHFAERPEYDLTLCGPHMRDRSGGARPTIPTAPNITLLDHISEEGVARLLGESEFFVHLSHSEACALVVREAMACGCRVWTLPAHAQDLRNVAHSWEEAVADADLGGRAAAEARETFDWSHIAQRHAQVYAETLARWRPATSAAAAIHRYRAVARPPISDRLALIADRVGRRAASLRRALRQRRRT